MSDFPPSPYVSHPPSLTWLTLNSPAGRQETQRTTRVSLAAPLEMERDEIDRLRDTTTPGIQGMNIEVAQHEPMSEEESPSQIHEQQINTPFLLTETPSETHLGISHRVSHPEALKHM